MMHLPRCYDRELGRPQFPAREIDDVVTAAAGDMDYFVESVPVRKSRPRHRPDRVEGTYCERQGVRRTDLQPMKWQFPRLRFEARRPGQHRRSAHGPVPFTTLGNEKSRPMFVR
ncbi:hypothetical protein C791_3513 [Amycolatopsis azurea DSM 43854]|uniref:Uncharacterized protein n=1 Tax=Amycolatopsis azurea DSM 43854 TaxID=1238180 RepID=M2NV20_9PSEU|nr:hypothetical protein C791_3513 [Amycolatopsis azurea DSM 43854]